MEQAFERFFPYADIRPAQRKAIEFALKAFVEDKRRFVVMELPTGVGKSAIGVTLGRCLHHIDSELGETSNDYKKGAYFLTTQKILQEQYVKDFGLPGGDMRQIMSSTNYQCKYHRRQPCSESLRLLKLEKDKSSQFYRTCSFSCTYKAEKRQFLDAPASVTNFSYFLAETMYAGQLTPRELLVLDEAHNAVTELSSFIEMSVSEHFAKQVLKLVMPKITTQHQAWKWIEGEYRPKLIVHIKHVEKVIDELNIADRLKTDFVNLAKQHEMLDKHMCKINRFIELYHDENWSFDITETEGRGQRRLEFKPIDVSGFAEQALFRMGKRVLMMSATILDHEGFCQMLGLPLDQVAFLSAPSPFPVDNHPIFAYPVAKMSASTIDAELPKMAVAVESILEQHPDDKGIIHCNSYKISKYLREHIKSDRLLFHGSEDRLRRLKEHVASSRPTVLVSPSMQEGIDLKDNLSRFQIVCKVPYPYLGDKLVRKRMNKWSWWYSMQTAKTLVQSLGRSVRSETDHAVSYILDADWERFFSRNSKLFPQHFKDALKN